MRRSLILLAVVGVLVPAYAPAQAATADAELRSRLTSAMRGAGGASGAYVVDAETGRQLFAVRSASARILGSTTKIFTTAAALDRHGPEGTLETSVSGTGSLLQNGTWKGDLYLRGGGDPTFGSAAFVQRNYGGGATVEALVRELAAAGIERVDGSVRGDETLFDFLRGGPDSRYGISIWVGPLSALSYNRGLATEGGGGFQSNPPGYAAIRLTAELERAGVDVTGRPGIAPEPEGALELADVESPPMSRLAQITNVRSDNFFAELLLKGLPAAPVAGERSDGDAIGTTAAGARLARAFARELGANPRLVDGSGVARGNRASPRQVVRVLTELRERPQFSAFFGSLAVAGRSGTLAGRLRGGLTRGRCHAKTGTFSGVSALSGYCETRRGGTVAYSILMNSGTIAGGRRIQDRMVESIVRFGPKSAPEPTAP